MLDGGEILDDLMVLFPTATRAPQVGPAPVTVAMSEDEQKVFAALGVEQAHIDEITVQSGLASHVVASNLMRLEMKRLVRPLPGLRYMRLV